MNVDGQFKLYCQSIFTSLSSYLSRWAGGKVVHLPFPYELDCLVYSSHKTGTQTITATLSNSGIRTQHIHSLSNVNLKADNGAFRSYLERYQLVNSRKLTVLSVFRLPLERHMSSFFQWFGEGVVREGLVTKTEATIIARYPVDQLQKIFINLIATRSLVGRKESLHELCGELAYPTSSLQFVADRGFTVIEDEFIRLVLFRFDILFPDFRGYLEKSLETKLIALTANVTEDKWYSGKFDEFKRTLLLKPDLIRMIHAEKKDLIDLFYPAQYEDIVNGQISIYGSE